ncbi:hypothetical protein S245_031347 [Arachis hypogaea]
MEHINLASQLVEEYKNNVQDIEVTDADGNTAFCMAAISGNGGIAKILLCKNPRITVYFQFSVWFKAPHQLHLCFLLFQFP